MTASSAHAPTTDTGDPRPPERTRHAIRGGIMGNFVDQFDIFLPVMALGPAAAQLFGEQDAVFRASLIFVATLIGRPLGSLVFGPIADRVGRTVVTQIALAGISLTTLLIALVPGHHVLGAATFWAVLILRFLGGVFLGGEYTSAVPLAMEWARPGSRGRVSGFIMAMSPCANATIAALTFALIQGLGPEDYAAWGWRIPFLIGAAMAAGMLAYYRLRIADAPGRQPAASAARPVAELASSGRRLWQVFVLMSGLWLFTYMAVTTFTAELGASGQIDAAHVSLVMMCATAVSAVAMAAAGHLSTFTGRRRFFVAFGLAAAVVSPLIFLAVFAVQGTGPVLMLAAALQVATVTCYGPVGAYLTERFADGVRSTGYGAAYSLSIVLPALYPYYLPPLQEALGRHGAVAALLVLAGLLVAIGGLLGPDTDRFGPLPRRAG
ncbi:MFS transporter [Kocuria palustris]|uniref:MFS transporter n=1 Tax=Kocuria palustris TaxID=71999 RepID=UPI0011A7098C|nr:MFS transporter [Kocuria palustris]